MEIKIDIPVNETLKILNLLEKQTMHGSEAERVMHRLMNEIEEYRIEPKVGDVIMRTETGFVYTVSEICEKMGPFTIKCFDESPGEWVYMIKDEFTIYREA